MPRLFVPSKDPVQRYEDILENVIFIEEFTNRLLKKGRR
jgi:hypothetical protein